MKLLAFLVTLWVLLTAAPALACGVGETCVSDTDLATFVKVAEEKACLTTTNPELTLDPMYLVEDKDGRVYFSGADPHPYKAHLKWCNYDADFKGDLKVVVGKSEPRVWGFDFRLKFAGSALPLDMAHGKWNQAVDLGLLWEFFHYKNTNLQIATGYRSVGLSVGYDITSNFGVFGGYAFSYWTKSHQPQAGIYFGFW